jgi:hypothetical protein
MTEEIAADTKATVLRDLATDYGITEASLESEWQKWCLDGEGAHTAPAETDQSSVKEWFLQHLHTAGLIDRDASRHSKPTGEGMDAYDDDNDLLYDQETDLVDVVDRVATGNGDDDYANDDDYDNNRYDNDTADFGEPIDYYGDMQDEGAVEEDVIVDDDYDDFDYAYGQVPKESGGNSSADKIDAEPALSSSLLESDQRLVEEIQQLQERVSSQSSGTRLTPSAASGLPEWHGDGIADEVFDKAEKMVMSALMKEATQKFGTTDDHDTPIDAAAAGEPLPIGPRVGRGRMRERITKYSLGKAVGRWSLRHRDSDPEKALDSGMQIGNALALRIVDKNRKESRRKRFPITSEGIRMRHNAILQVCITGMAAAGDTSENAGNYSNARMRQLHDDLRQYADAVLESVRQAGNKITDDKQQLLMAGEIIDRHVLQVGGIWDRLRSLRRGTARKVRALMNEVDMRVVIRAILAIANHAVPRPGERVISGFGRDAEVTRRIDAFGLSLNHELTASLRRGEGRAVRNENASYIAIDLFYGIVFAFVTHPELLPFALDLAGKADSILDTYNVVYDDADTNGNDTMMEASNGKFGRNAAARSGSKAESGIPCTSLQLTAQLVSGARDLLASDAKLRERVHGDKLLLLVPADKGSLVSVQERLLQSDEGFTKFVKNALLTQHPHAKQNQANHVISLTGQVVHMRPLSPSTARQAPTVTGSSKVVPSQCLQFMERSQPPANDNSQHSNTDMWAREAQNIGGALVENPDRLPMHCLAGNPRKITLTIAPDPSDTPIRHQQQLKAGHHSQDSGQKKTLYIKPMFYWPDRHYQPTPEN